MAAEGPVRRARAADGGRGPRGPAQGDGSQALSAGPVLTIEACRVCGGTHLRPLLDLGVQALTGRFPKDSDPPVPRGPLQLVQCDTGRHPEACGLVQLRHSFDPDAMYGLTYGYRSSLNRSMVHHLGALVERLRSRVPLGRGDLVLDIGSNDGTLLGCFEPGGPDLVGIDPTSAKFRSYYRHDIRAIPKFFSADVFREHFGERKAKLVTSIAMFYDLEQPLLFMRHVHDILADDGLWCLEQSYLPTMLVRNSYDTVCHEHLEYYGLRQIEWMARRTGFSILDVTLNDVNGGSFAVFLGKSGSAQDRSVPAAVQAALTGERESGLDRKEPFEAFRGRVEARRVELLALLDRIRASGATVLGYGASTKGNVLLQYCGLGPDRLPMIAEVNEDKFGCVTPGTGIRIVSESEARSAKPDYFLVLPWHFRDAIVAREAAFLKGGGRLIFPLPEVDVVSA